MVKTEEALPFSPCGRNGNAGEVEAVKSSPQRYDHLFKIILIGDQSVGKTNLTMRFCNEGFSQSYMATIGIDFKVKTVEVKGNRVKLQIWDTAGQERFRTISRIYYRGAQGVMFVFDITSRPTFENIRNWITIFDEVSGECSKEVQKIMVGNKCDQPFIRQVPQDLGEIVAERYGMRYFETSAKTGKNVEEVFSALTEGILSHQDARKKAQDQSSMLSKIQLKKKQRPSSRKQSWSWSKCTIL